MSVGAGKVAGDLVESLLRGFDLTVLVTDVTAVTVLKVVVIVVLVLGFVVLPVVVFGFVAACVRVDVFFVPIVDVNSVVVALPIITTIKLDNCASRRNGLTRDIFVTIKQGVAVLQV